MKKPIRTLTFLIILMLIVQLPLLAYSEITMVEITKNASIRTKSSYDGDKISLATVGNQYEYLRTEGKWYAIQVESGKIGFLPIDSCKLIKIADSSLENNQEALDADYQAGIKYMDEGRFFSAYEAFQKSNVESTNVIAQKCIQSWPKTGELWHNPSVTGNDIALTIKVIQESDQATLVKIYQGDLHAADMFIGGTGQATIDLPAGQYIIKDGVGSNWFGEIEAFGKSGLYETMLFDDNEAVFQPGYAYTFTISATKPDSQEHEIASTYLTWEDFYND